MSARSKRKDKGGVSTIAQRAATGHSNVAKAEARDTDCSHAPAALPTTPSLDVAGGACLSTDAGLFPCPPAKRLRCSGHQQRGKKRTAEQQQGKREIQDRYDMETPQKCPVDSSASIACRSTFCSTPVVSLDVVSPPVTSLQESLETMNKEASLQNRSRWTTSASPPAEKGDVCGATLCVSEDVVAVKRADLTGRKRRADSQLSGSSAHLCPPHGDMAEGCAATGNGTARAGSDTFLDSSRVKYNGELLILASDPLSPTKKLLHLTESGESVDCFDHAEDPRASLEGRNESDINDETAERDGLLLTGGPTQSSLLQTHQGTTLPSTPTPRLLLNRCCSSGVRTPLAGSPLSMSSQASTNSAFSASPLTCCSSIGPGSVPATPSCWLSDELSPHQTQQQQTTDGLNSAGTVLQQEQQEDASLLLWKAIAASTPMRNNPAVSSNIRPAEGSPDNEDEEGCPSLLSLSLKSSRFYSSQRLSGSYPDSTAAADNGSSIESETVLLSDATAAEQATKTSYLSTFPFSSASAECVESAAAVPTGEHVKSFCNRRDHQPNGSSMKNSDHTVTREGEQQTNSTLVSQSGSDVQSYLESAGRQAALGGSAQCIAAAERAPDASCSNNDDEHFRSNGKGESWEEHQVTSSSVPVCKTRTNRRCSEVSPLSSAEGPSAAGVSVTPVSLPLQLPIPARAPRGKVQNGQVGCQQQRVGLLNLQSPRSAAPAAGDIEKIYPAAPARHGDAVESRNVAAGGNEEMTGDFAATTEKTAGANKREGETDTKSLTLLLPTLLEHAGSISSNSSFEEGKHIEGTSRRRPQLPTGASFLKEDEGTQQRQQAAALNAMERAAARAKLAARAAAACAAVIDAAAAAARNAAAASAANRGSAGTTAGYYTEYPDLQRNIHDDYDLFCNAAAGAEAFLQSISCSNCSGTCRFDSADAHERLRKSLGTAEGTEKEFHCLQTCHDGDRKNAHKFFFWPETGGCSTWRCPSASATNDDSGTGCTECTDSQDTKIILEGDTGAPTQRDNDSSGSHGGVPCGGVACVEELICVSTGKGTSSDSYRPRPRSLKGESREATHSNEIETEPPREGTQESEFQELTSGALKASPNCFSPSSSIKTNASRYTWDPNSSSCSYYCCCCCRRCSCSKFTGLASSPRSHPGQKPQRCCDPLAGTSSTPLLPQASAQHYYSLPAATSYEDDLLNCVGKQACLNMENDTVAREENDVQSTSRDSIQAYAAIESEAQVQKNGSLKGWLSGNHNPTVSLPCTESLENTLAASEEGTEEISKSMVPIAHGISTLRSASGGTRAAAPEARAAAASDKRRRHVVLGAGRFGKVVLGQHNHSGLLVAIKIIDKNRVRGTGSEKDNVNFRQEIEMHRRLPAHRNIVTVYDVYEDRKSIYLVMELCDRVSLLDKLAEEGPLREDLARQVFLQILAAVKHCHDHHVMHRDLKPENVLFAHQQQKHTTGGRRRLPPRLPSALNRCDCRPLKRNKAAGSPKCNCIVSRCLWMPRDDSSREKQAVHRRASSGCCCAKWEVGQTSIWPYCHISMHLKTQTTTKHEDVQLGGAFEEGGSYHSREYCEGHEERCTLPLNASDLSESSRALRVYEALQQPEVHREQILSHEIQHPQSDYQLPKNSVLYKRPATQSGSPTPEVILCDSRAKEEAKPSDNSVGWLRNTQASIEGNAARDSPSAAMVDCCCCRRSQGHEEAAERASWNNRLLSLQTSQQREDPPTVKLIDFGAACSSSRGQLRGTACGTTHYLAPEVLTGNYYDAFASDAWSLGVILFTMLSGAPPFDGLTHSRLTRQIVRGEYRMDGLVWWKVSADAKNLIFRLLDVNPQTRITVNEAARHPWVLKALPSGLPSFFFENAHCLSSLAAAAGEATHRDGECWLSSFDQDNL